MIDLGKAAGDAGEATAHAGQPPARVGDEVILLGNGAGGEPLADEWADAADTINYEIVTHLGAHIPRTYVRSGVEGAQHGRNPHD